MDVIGQALARLSSFAGLALCAGAIAYLGLLQNAGAQAVWVPDVPVTVQIVSAPGVVLKVGHLLREPMRFRVVRRSDATPLPNVNLSVFVNYRLCTPLLDCPDLTGLYGTFETAGSPSSLSLVTDADGIASTPLFRAGSVSGRYDIAAAVYRMDNETTGYISSSGSASVPVNQIGSAVFEIPATSTWVLALLGELIVLSWVITRRRESPI